MKKNREKKFQIPDSVLEKLNQLFLSWKVQSKDWALATEPALQRQGYAIYDEKNPYEIDLWVKATSLPWKAKSGWMTLPPRNSKFIRQLERFVKNAGYSVHMVPAPFAGFKANRLDDSVSYGLPNGKSIRILSPALYLEQLTCLITHPLTRGPFSSRIPKFVTRTEILLKLAEAKNDHLFIKACKKFLRLVVKLGRQKVYPSTFSRNAIADKGFVNGQGIGKKVIKGKVRVILHARDFGKMRKGEILVTYDTNPEFLLILRKMKAIVTDNGGISCHASVIAREFSVPAVVGTRFATKIFKTCDLVEVDANKGIVRKV